MTTQALAAYITAGPDVDYNALPEDTYLRRELKKRLIKGEPLHTGWGYFIEEQE